MHAVEYEYHDWGNSPTRQTEVTLSRALDLLSAFPNQEATQAAAKFSGRPLIMFKRGANDYCHFTHEEGETFIVHIYYRAAGHTQYGVARADSALLLQRYFREPHFNLFRSLVRADSGLTIFGTGLRSRMLSFLVKT